MTGEQLARVNRLAVRIAMQGPLELLARELDEAGFVLAGEARPREVTLRDYENLLRVVERHQATTTPPELLGTLLALLGLVVEAPRTDTEKIADFARTLARLLPHHETLTRDQLADLVRERLGVEI